MKLSLMTLCRLSVILAATQLAACSGDKTEAIKVGFYENAPKIYSGQDGKPAGLFVELLRAIAEKEHWNLQFVACAWNDCLQMIQTGELDLMPDVAFSNERTQKFDFHRTSVASSWSQVFVQRQLSIQTLEDMAGKRVAVLKGGIQQGFLDKLMKEAGLSYQAVAVQSLVEGYDAVVAGTADAVVSNSFFAARNGAKYRLKETPIVFLPVNLYFAAGKGRSAEWLSAIDRHLDDWRQDADSVYFKAMRRAMAQQQESVLPRGLLWGLGSLLVLVIVLFVVSLLLQNRRIREHVAAATRELDDSKKRLEQEVATQSRLTALALELQKTGTAAEVGQLILALLAERLGCHLGGVGVVMPEAIHVIARYGLADDSPTLPLNQGLPGQVLREGTHAHVVLPQDNEWRIRSGLGSMLPSETWCFPVRHGSEIVGVIEMALTRPLDETGHRLIEQLLTVVAMPLSEIRRNQKKTQGMTS